LAQGHAGSAVTLRPLSREEDDAVTLVRVYCGLASADRPVPVPDAQSWLTVAVVDDSGRLLDLCQVNDDPGGYAELCAVFAQRGDLGGIPVATDDRRHAVTQLLCTAGRYLAFPEDESPDELGERFADDDSVDEIRSRPAERRAIGLARALQAGVLSAVPHAPPKELVGLKPLLAAHTALVTGRQQSAGTLREVLRELYPAALRAYADPAEAVPLAVLEALPEPAQLATGASGRTRESQVISKLTELGVAEKETLVEAVTALRVAVGETRRPSGVTRAMASAVADTVRHAVAAVRSCDAATASLVAVIADRMTPSVSAPAVPVPVEVARGTAPLRVVSDQPRPAVVGRRSRDHTPSPVPMATPQPSLPAPVPEAPRPAARLEKQAPAAELPSRVPTPIAPSTRQTRSANAASYPGVGHLPPAGQLPPASAPPTSHRGTAEVPGTEQRAPAAYNSGTHGAGTQGSGAQGSGAYGQIQRPEGASGSYSGAASVGGPGAPLTRARPAYDPLATPNGPHDAPETPAGPPVPRLSPEVTPPVSRSTWPLTSPPAAGPGQQGQSPGQQGQSPGQQGQSPGRQGQSPGQQGRDDETGAGRAVGAAEVPRLVELPRQREGRVTPPWQADDLPPEPPTLRLVEPAPLADPALSGARPVADELGTDLRLDPPPLRLVDPEPERPVAVGHRMLDRGVEPPIDSSTDDSDLLIFAECRSAWFTEPGADDEAELEWATAADLGWQAAQQAAQPVVGAETTAGLPRRVPQQNLVPGSPAPEEEEERPLRIVRDAAAIAAHTSGYFRGYRRGQEVGGYSVGGRPGRESAVGWDFSRDTSGGQDFPAATDYEFRSAR
jgi:hypothetical protein